MLLLGPLTVKCAVIWKTWRIEHDDNHVAWDRGATANFHYNQAFKSGRLSLPQSVRFHPLKPNLLVDPGSVHGLRHFNTQHKTQSSII